MYCSVLQDWTTVKGSSAVTVFSPSETCWLDFAGFQDLVAWLDVKEFSPSSGGTTLVLSYQTAPTKDEALFAAMASVLLSNGLTTTVILKELAFIPPARWIRWSLTTFGPPAAWEVTFRIWVAANRVGRRAP
jgi:hypothetical protein